MGRRKTVSEQLRLAIRESAFSRYRLSKLSGVDQAALSRFLSGERGLSLESADRLCDALNLELQPQAAER